jgi:oligopeptide/dipeptide ABC transporter ATP-binding protein
MIDSTCNNLLTVRNLRTAFDTEEGTVVAVDGVDFAIGKGKTFALVGESGCGKSVTAMSILRLLPITGRIAAGSVALDGVELTTLNEPEMRAVRGGKIGMIFQEPMTSLNPVFTCGMQIAEAMRLHRNCSARQARRQTIDLLGQVGIPAPTQRFDEYPHQLSGGMRQRVMIAMALSCEPDVLIADEPTTALDVTIQAQILALLKDLQAQRQLSVLLITHDLAVVAEAADEVGVMYAGKLVERTDVKQLFATPLHPYTQGLFRSLVRLETQAERLNTIAGSVADPAHRPPGCPFHPRCPLAENDKRCTTQMPPMRQVAPGHFCACWQCQEVAP